MYPHAVTSESSSVHSNIYNLRDDAPTHKKTKGVIANKIYFRERVVRNNTKVHGGATPQAARKVAPLNLPKGAHRVKIVSRGQGLILGRQTFRNREVRGQAEASVGGFASSAFRI